MWLKYITTAKSQKLSQGGKEDALRGADAYVQLILEKCYASEQPHPFIWDQKKHITEKKIFK